MLCLALASDSELENMIISQLRVVRRIGNFLEFAYVKEMEYFIEPILNLSKVFLLCAVGNIKGFVYDKQPKLLTDGFFSDSSNVVDEQQRIDDIGDFGANVGVLLELSKSDEQTVSNLSSECIVLLMKVAPREAMTGFLINLPKVILILESWEKRDVVSELVVNSVLHLLGYSCRQYLSSSMMLSISLKDISRVESLVFQIKNAGSKGIHESAFKASLELNGVGPVSLPIHGVMGVVIRKLKLHLVA